MDTVKRSNINEIEIGVAILRCQHEAKQGRKSERHHCYELFRRAIDEGNERAWQAIYLQYTTLVHYWLSRKHQGNLDGDITDELASDTFAKFWRTLTSRQISIAEKFPHIGAVHRYMNQCAISVLHDFHRREQRKRQLETHLQTQQSSLIVADDMLEQIENRDRQAKVRAYLAENVTDSAEKLFLQLAYEYDLTPREIVKQYPEQFPDAKAVYRIKERILKRVKRGLQN